MPAHQVEFNEWLKTRRKELDLTQVELAKRVNCTVFALRKLGRLAPNCSFFRRVDKG